MVVTLVMSAQSPVELTPFRDGVMHYDGGVQMVWDYVRSIGYNINCNVHNDTTVYGTDGAKSIERIYAAYNPKDKSVVVLISDVWDYNFNETVEHLKWVNFQWMDKKLMPKGLPKKDLRKYYDNMTVTIGTHKNNYFMSIIGNQWKGSDGFNILHTFSAIINGEYVDGSWLE